MFEQREIIDLAIHLERNGYRTYRRAATRITDKKLVSLLEWMAEEEEAHAEKFSRIKQQLASTPADIFSDKMTEELIRSAVGDQVFSLEEADFSGCKMVRDLVRLFITFEEDTITFYEMLATFTLDPEARRLLDTLVAEEKKHIELLDAFCEDDAPLPSALLQPVA